MSSCDTHNTLISRKSYEHHFEVYHEHHTRAYQKERSETPGQQYVGNRTILPKNDDRIGLTLDELTSDNYLHCVILFTRSLSASCKLGF